MLDTETTLELVRQAKLGSEEAKEKLVNENFPLIKSVIRFYKNKGVDYDDLYQLGCLGFLKAINNFDLSFNVKFSTYAVPMVAGEVKRFLRDDGSIKISRSIKTLYNHLSKYIYEYKKNNFDNEPTLEHLAEKFNVEKSDIVFALDSSKSLLSLDEKQDETSSKSRTIIETIIDEDASESMINNLALKSIVNELSGRDKQLLLLRFYQDKTQSEIAEALGVSQVQVSRLENKIIEKIRTKFKQ